MSMNTDIDSRNPGKKGRPARRVRQPAQ